MCDLDHGSFSCQSSFTHHKDIGKSRTDHLCDECNTKIPAGRPYRRAAGKFEGEFWSAAYCARCAKAQDWLLKRGHGWLGGQILDDVRYCVAEDLRRVAAGPKARTDST